MVLSDGVLTTTAWGGDKGFYDDRIVLRCGDDDDHHFSWTGSSSTSGGKNGGLYGLHGLHGDDYGIGNGSVDGGGAQGHAGGGGSHVTLTRRAS